MLNKINKKYFLLTFLTLIAISFLYFILRDIDFVYNEPVDPTFKVYGNEEIMKDMIINIRFINFAKYCSVYTESKIQTLLNKGQQYLHKKEETSIDYYEIYFSYKDKVGMVGFENLDKPFNGNPNRINEIHIEKIENGINLKHFVSKKVINEDYFIRDNTDIDLDIFFNKNQSFSLEDDKVKYRDRFFKFYNPDEQIFTREPLQQKRIDEFKKLPLKLKKTYGILEEDLIKMDLPQEELDEILKYYKENNIYQ